MTIPHISCQCLAKVVSLITIFLLALLTPLQVVAVESSSTPEQVLTNATSQESAQTVYVDQVSMFLVKASSYIKKVNRSLSDNDARAFAS